MSKWALIVAGTVGEVTEVDPKGRFHPSLVWVKCRSDVQEGWQYDGKSFSQPDTLGVTEPNAEPITRRQLRLTLVRNGIPLAGVEAAIAAMPDGLPKEEAQIEWADASTFRRDHPTLLLIAKALSLTEDQIEAMWQEALIA